MFGIGPEFDNKQRPVIIISPITGGSKTFQIYEIDIQPIKINSVDTAKSSGGVVAVQIKPSKSGSSTSDLTGLEVSPRTKDAPCGALICIKADPVLKEATSARTVGAVRGLEVNIDFPGAGSAYTITNETCAIRVFGDFGAGHTFTGKKSIVVIAGVNTSQWEYFIDFVSNNADLLVDNTDTPAFGIPIRHHGTNYWIMCSNALS